MVRPHHQKELLRSKHAIFGEDIQKGVFGKERLGEIHQISDGFILCIRPIAGELKTMTCFLALFPTAIAEFFYVIITGGVAVIFRVCPIGDDEDLDIFRQAAGSPKAVPLVLFI